MRDLREEERAEDLREEEERETEGAKGGEGKC